MVASSELPVIDISRFTNGCPEQRAAVAKEWDDTFRTVGFCLLSGYESILPEDLIKEMREQTSAFFAQPAPDKLKAYVDGMVGFLGFGAENVGASAGQKTVGPDLVESLNFPYQEPGSTWTVDTVDKESPWASADWVGAVPERLRAVTTKYWAAATKLMQTVNSLTELSLDLPAGYFDSSYAQPGALLRLAYYPAEGQLKALEDGDGEPQQRYGAHTDYDGFTILQRDPADEVAGGGGLEIQMWDTGKWTSVAAPPGTLTINIGDLLARWTNDRWRATRHRVTRPAVGSEKSTMDRLSMVFFTGPHPDTLVKCLPSSKCSEGNPRYAPITAGDHVTAKLTAAAQDALSEAEPASKRAKSI